LRRFGRAIRGTRRKGLQRMAALHMPATVAAPADLHIELAHDGAPHFMRAGRR
jgi:hypothetical protein